MELLKMLANGTRMRILRAVIDGGELSVKEIANVTGMYLSKVSHELADLVNAGLLWARRSHPYIYYSLGLNAERHADGSVTFRGGGYEVKVPPAAADPEG